MKPLAHARLCSTRRGGTWSDTIALHTWLDSSKTTFASVQHRALLHHDLGAVIAARIFGSFDLPTGLVSAYDLIADHVVEDLGELVPVSRWLDTIDASAMATRRVPPDRRNVLPLRTDTAQVAAERWGGTPECYVPALAVLDLPTVMSGGHPRGRALFHNSFGPFVAEQVVGPAIEIDGDRLVPTRTVIEDVILARVGWIPPAAHILGKIPLLPWMAGSESTPAIARRKSADRALQRGFAA